MATQYPHFLFIHKVTEASQDASGNWVNSTDSWVLHGICREEAAGDGAVVNVTDGRAIAYSSSVYLPKSVAKIAEGVEVLVSEKNSLIGPVRAKGQVLKFSAGQLSSKLRI